MAEETLLRTPLFEAHCSLGAKMVPFGGWEMPVQYSGVIEEHRNVRTNCGLFDVSHMGEIFVTGPEALSALQYLTTNDVSKLEIGRAQYSAIPNETGGAVDDIIVYCLGREEYLICVNASNRAKDFAWLVEKNPTRARIEDASSEYAQLAIQGPRAIECLEGVLGISLKEVAFFSILPVTLALGRDSVKALFARTGYTGEDGFEVFLPAAYGVSLWERLLEGGKRYSLLPIGLGARDTLRLEACLALYGHELREDVSILASGLGWVTKFEKGEFIGRKALVAERERGVSTKLVGFEVLDPGIVRDGVKIFDAESEVGFVTSGTKTPTLGKSVALGYVPASQAAAGTQHFADVRGRKLKMQVVKTPFYRRQKN